MKTSSYVIYYLPVVLRTELEGKIVQIFCKNRNCSISCGMRIEEKCRRALQSPKYRGLETAPTN